MKAKSDSILKARAQQSPEFGQKVIDWMRTPKSETCVGGIAYARQQLALDGIVVRSDSTFSDFWSWWFLQETFQRIDRKTSDFEELLASKFPEMDPKRIQEFGQAFFTMEATARGDAKEFREMEWLRVGKETAAVKGRQEEKKLELAERRVVLLEGKITEAKEKLTKVANLKGGVSPEALKVIEAAAKILS